MEINTRVAVVVALTTPSFAQQHAILMAGRRTCFVVNLPQVTAIEHHQLGSKSSPGTPLKSDDKPRVMCSRTEASMNECDLRFDGG